MSRALQNLQQLLELEKLDKGLFRARSEDIGLRQLFGGQVIGQALHAARQTIQARRLPHSFHSYFLRPGDSQKDIIYEVETLRDGQSFSARRVSAVQNGQPIFFMTASFQTPEAGFEHQKKMPEVVGPDHLPGESEIARQLAHLIPPQAKDKFLAEKPLEIRPVKFFNPLKGEIAPPFRHVWIRANGTLPEEHHLHQYLLSYASDLNFLPVALQPHGKGFLEPDMQVATIDHSMWFHRQVNLNEWLLYSIESTSASAARGFVKGEFFTRDGTLVASTAQEGLIRIRQQA